ncbi:MULTISPECIES: hypothetical protein [Flectobacillus]|uniref:hypothetical protein n=1 Tax=Flectobacillus TaxID=101 RepID=UPI000BA2FEF3|nr:MULTISPECIES: hypothetical protein [Flectobacillus]MDI9872720.1 hypothetical protein [Flectobacillus roseus]PAC33331.1 hypothetical protein BWI92_02145 [Flectobacillus sp. BAB-3569]
MAIHRKEETKDYSKGFAEGSYEWIMELKIKRLRLEKEKLEKRINEIYHELTEILFPECTGADKGETQAKQNEK